MSPNDPTVARQGGVATLERAKFGPGMLLRDDDLEQLNTYPRALSRLLFRSLFGCGVVCGLVVSVKTQCGKVSVTVQAGLALDGCGDPVCVPRTQDIIIDAQCEQQVSGPLWVVLCRTEKSCAPRVATCSPDDDDATSMATRVRDGFEIRVVRTRPDPICGCPEPKPKTGTAQDDSRQVLADNACWCAESTLTCYADHYAGTCTGNCADGSDCPCECVLLARLDSTTDGETTTWTVDHRVRRFIRPVLMRDPQVEKEDEARTQAAQGNSGQFALNEVSTQSAPPKQPATSEPGDMPRRTKTAKT